MIAVEDAENPQFRHVVSRHRTLEAAEAAENKAVKKWFSANPTWDYLWVFILEVGLDSECEHHANKWQRTTLSAVKIL